MGVFAPIEDYLGTLVHPSALGDALTAARHRAFIAPRLLAGVVGLALLPLYLIVRGTPRAIELVVLVWLVLPLFTAYFLSRTGRYESAQVLSLLALCALTTAVAAATGGIASFAVVWLALVPIEAALSMSPRLVAFAFALTLGAATVLTVLGSSHLLPTTAPARDGYAVPAELGVIAAALYATVLAFGAETLVRAGSLLSDTERDRYHLLASHMTDVITRHARNGDVTFVSPAAQSVFASPAVSLLGRGLFERIHVADRPAYLAALGEAASFSENRPVEFRVRCSREAEVAAQFAWIEMHCRPLEVPSAASNCGDREVVAVLRDVSGRKRHEQALAAARADAERVSVRNSRFLATMSHELRTPLNAIIGFSEMLMKEQVLMLDHKQRREYAALISDSGRHLLSVVNGILDISKIETNNFAITAEPFVPAPVVSRCCDLVALEARAADVEIENSADGDLPELIADKRALSQILLNLLSNAIRFSERGGKVVIGARAEAGAVVFTVQDHGIGIGEEDLARVGEPYFQARGGSERRGGGTGLGLSIVKGLVRLQGGELSIWSRLGEGTRVTVRLPLDCEKARPQGGSVAAEAGEGPENHGTARLAAHFDRSAADRLPGRGLSSFHEIPVKKSA